MRGHTGNKPALVIADDDEDLLLVMQHALKSQGFAVRLSPNGVNLLDMVIKDPPDLVLLDISMDKVDGGTVCRMLKYNSSTRHIPIVMISGNDDIELISQQCGANGCIKKPFDVERIKAEYLRISDATNKV